MEGREGVKVGTSFMMMLTVSLAKLGIRASN